MVFAMDKTLKRLAQYFKNARMWKDTIFIFSTGKQISYTLNFLKKEFFAHRLPDSPSLHNVLLPPPFSLRLKVSEGTHEIWIVEDIQ